jgi:hypothetical protein
MAGNEQRAYGQAGNGHAGYGQSGYGSLSNEWENRLGSSYGPGSSSQGERKRKFSQ